LEPCNCLILCMIIF